ncbi:polyphosphate kinase 2 [Dictyobacter kobayashii]|uniref:ADP/GDP-polyphosphate phosphotransferase n=1 Tax=Dictyobacter kobayashii TaxID=2014872 RepID=A0A402ARV5_9CHLR|nr:polyphosphate kinase 2 [Dictyobacter kobayashii]GCE21829.1 polyphosphate kinase 2 [Dictyobacter kobayashii]
MKSKLENYKQPVESESELSTKLSRKYFEKELEKLQMELVKLQTWVVNAGLKVVVVFEGRDAAGKGGVIKRITERVSPRVFHVVALPTPTEREKTQMYFQRYLVHLPAAGEVMLFDRSWYNRAGVEYVMGFCTEQEHRDFLELCPAIERTMIDSGIILIKYWFEVSQQEQERRFQSRIEDGRKVWKLSPMDLEAHRRWYDYARAKDEMFLATDTPEAPWYVVPADNKRRARLNCITHFLSQVPYKEVPSKSVRLPERQPSKGYREPERAYNVIPQIH